MKNKKKIIGATLGVIFLGLLLQTTVAMVTTETYVEKNYKNWNYRYKGIRITKKDGYTTSFENEKGDDLVLTMNSMIFPNAIQKDSKKREAPEDFQVLGYDNGLKPADPATPGVPIYCRSDNQTYQNIKIQVPAGELVTKGAEGFVSHGAEFKGRIQEVVYWRGGTFSAPIPLTIYGVTSGDTEFAGTLVASLQLENLKDHSGVRLIGCDAYTGSLDSFSIARGN